MASQEDICRKIEEVIPEAGKCNMDFTVDYDKANKAWAVNLQDREGHRLKTFIDDIDADSCLEKDHCISLAMQVGQLRRSLKLYPQA